MSEEKTNEQKVEPKKEDVLAGIPAPIVLESEGSQEEETPEGQPEGKTEEVQEPPKKESSEETGSTAKEDEKNVEIETRVSKATAKNDESLKSMLKLFKGKPEKLKELEENNPELFERIKQREPDFLNSLSPDEPETPDEVEELSSLLKEMMDKEEKKDAKTWADAHEISDEDYEEREANMLRKARVLLKNSLVPNWDKAVEVAGGITFPHTASSGVSEGKLDDLGNSGTKVNKNIQKTNDDLDETDKESMVITGASEEEFNKYQQEEIGVPM